MNKNLFLIGPMAAGKTTIGKALAEAIQFTFYDSDRYIEESTGADIPWIFDLEGEEGFRKRETLVLDLLTQKQGIVLATGGGAIASPENRKMLASRGIVIYLKANIESQLKRTERGRNRPLLLGVDHRDVFERLSREREHLYTEIADYVIDTQLNSIQATVQSILEKVGAKIF